MQSSLKVIIADDHPIVLLGLEQTLARIPFIKRVSKAHDGRQLIQMLHEDMPDLIVSDYSMPGADTPDGLILFRHIRRLAPQCKLIILTMLDNVAFIESMLKSGADGVMNKQDDLADLAEAIQSVMVGRQYLGRSVLHARALAGQMPDEETGGLRTLSQRELEVMRLYATGRCITEIAQQLNRSVKTISHQKKSAMEKLGARNDMELFQLARELHLIV
ncbi:response regulator [Silvimonas sp. JCM 19000]